MINANLLPPELKEEIAQSKKNGRAVKYAWGTFGILILVLVMAALLWYFFNQSLNTATADLNRDQEQTKQYGSLEIKAKKLAERITAVKKIDAATYHWSGVITEIQNVMPAGLYLKSVRIDSSAKVRGQITGYAKSKQEVATLRDSMDKSKLFEFVDIESSVTEKDSKTGSDKENFTITFSLSKGALE